MILAAPSICLADTMDTDTLCVVLPLLSLVPANPKCYSFVLHLLPGLARRLLHRSHNSPCTGLSGDTWVFHGPLLLLRLQGSLHFDQLLTIFALIVAVNFGENFQNLMNLLPIVFVKSCHIKLNVFIVFGVSIEYFLSGNSFDMSNLWS